MSVKEAQRSTHPSNKDEIVIKTRPSSYMESYIQSHAYADGRDNLEIVSL